MSQVDLSPETDLKHKERSKFMSDSVPDDIGNSIWTMPGANLLLILYAAQG